MINRKDIRSDFLISPDSSFGDGLCFEDRNDASGSGFLGGTLSFLRLLLGDHAERWQLAVLPD